MLIRKSAALAALLALTAGCESQGVWKERFADQANEHKASRDTQYKDRVANERIERNVKCIAAIDWQRPAIGRGSIGPADAYIDFYRAQLETTLGDRTIPAANGAPELSKGTIDAYLDWARAHYVATEFTAGGDTNGDGTASLWEKRIAGVDFTHGCLQMAIEMGTGPLGKLQPYQRHPEVQRLRDHLHGALRAGRDA